jgi:hypothetical protein
MSLIAVVNIVLWLRKRRDAEDRTQLVLSGIYVFVCAFRSFVPRADVQRICFFDSFWASVFVGRSVATVAEISFMTQLVLTGRMIARTLGSRPARMLATIPLPLIVVAECFSWYAVITTNYFGNFVEESLWTTSGVLFAVALVLLIPRAGRELRMRLVAVLAGTVAYVTFMLSVDVRMYLGRLLADSAEKRSYLGFSDGLHDVISRRVVTFAWADWHQELAWMFLYFSITVWFSLSLINAKRLFARG